VLLGKLLRIDVSVDTGYGIPSGNPFVDKASTRPEIWALGLRNPWRFSFDRVTGDLYIADVGQNRLEEINFEPFGGPGGLNYGWDIMEASLCFEPNEDCLQTDLQLPIVEYDRSGGCSVTGGRVYRGNQQPLLEGIYFYGDFCSGNVWGLRYEEGEWHTALLMSSNLAISSFGEDSAGEVYVLDYLNGGAHRIVALP